MNNPDTMEASSAAAHPSEAGDADDAELAELVEEDLLVEEISIDGMCGVY
jgi:mycofactocin precursor